MSHKTKIKYPVAMRWTIPEAELQELRNSNNGCLKSAKRAIAGTDIQYYMSIHPNGFNDKKRGKTCIAFGLSFKEQKKIKAKYTFSVESANFCKTCSDVYEKTEGIVYLLSDVDEFFDHSSHFIVDGEMDVNLDGFLMIEQDYTIRLNELGSDADSFFLNLWNQETKDFTIVADGKEIKAHKIILSARSPVFQAMFQPHTKEAQESKVEIPDFSFKIVEAAIKLCYHSSLVNEIEFQDIILLLQFFDKYDIQSLKEKSEKYLISKLNETNVCSLYNGSVLSNAPKLRKKCSEFLLECIHAQKPVADLDLLVNDVALDLFKKAFHPIV